MNNQALSSPWPGHTYVPAYFGSHFHSLSLFYFTELEFVHKKNDKGKKNILLAVKPIKIFGRVSGTLTHTHIYIYPTIDTNKMKKIEKYSSTDTENILARIGSK